MRIVMTLTEAARAYECAVFYCSGIEPNSLFFGLYVDLHRHRLLDWPIRCVDLWLCIWSSRTPLSQRGEAVIPSCL